jgi:type I restriction enzyme R subunit
MRDVRSAQYFEQMKGRGARTIAQPTSSPSPRTRGQDPLRHRRRRRRHRARLRRPAAQPRQGVSLKKLLDKRRQRSPSPRTRPPRSPPAWPSSSSSSPRRALRARRGRGQPVRDIVRALVDAVDPDTQAKASKGPPTPAGSIRELLEPPSPRSPPTRTCAPASSSCAPPTTESSTRSTRTSCSTPTESSTPTGRGRSSSPGRSTCSTTATRSPRSSSPPKPRSGAIAFADIQELADRISRPPHNWTPDIIWHAYEAVDVGRVRHSDRHTLTDLVSLLRYTVGVDNELVPYAEKVQERYAAWLAQQEQAGTEFSPWRGGGWTGWST